MSHNAQEAISAFLSAEETTPFCLIQGDDVSGTDGLLMLFGDAGVNEKLVDIPRNSDSGALPHVTYDTVSMIPFCQITERGFKAHNSGEKIITLNIKRWDQVPTKDFCASFEDENVELAGDGLTFDTNREEYVDVVTVVKEQMIANGEGSSFVTPRKCSGKIKDFSKKKALVIFRRLLLNEYGTYWKFLFSDGKGHYFIGASPERHLTVRNNKVEMNPISGTFRKNPKCTPEEELDNLWTFLRNEKEIDELFMVTDEELKMMAAMCKTGGDIKGPLLKQMGALIHTEYLLSGEKAGKDIIELFRQSMFAPTVTGSPMGNACACVYTVEKNTRSYYSSAILLMGRETTGEEFLDSSITIRTQEILQSGDFSVRVGATLVKDSIPVEEVEECEAKIRGSIRSLSTNVAAQPPLNIEAHEGIMKELPLRNARLSRFWMERQDKNSNINPHLDKKKLVLMSNEDDFAVMLAYLLKALGLEVVVHDFSKFKSPEVIAEALAADFVCIGPGPGDPTNEKHEKMVIVRDTIKTLRDNKKKFLCVCLGHQIMHHMHGFEVCKKAVPTQGVQTECDLFGKTQKLGFYNAFYVKHDPEKEKAAGFLEVALLNDELIGVHAPDFVAFQFHPESILTQNGLEILNDAMTRIATTEPKSE